jgi:hypothetical protein
MHTGVQDSCKNQKLSKAMRIARGFISGYSGSMKLVEVGIRCPTAGRVLLVLSLSGACMHLLKRLQ